MVGSNNLHLDSKLNSSIAYQIPQIKVCAKPMKSPGDSTNLLKKPHSPRSLPMETFMHNSQLVQNITKYAATNVVSNFNHLRGLQPSPTAGTGGYNKLVTFEGLQGSVPVSSYGQQQQQAVRITKSSAPPSFANVSNISSSPVSLPVNPNLNNGVGMCAMSPSTYSNPSPSYPSNAVSPYSVQISSPANSVSSITGIKSPIPSPQNIRPPTPQPILPQAFQQIPVMTSGPNLVQIIHASNSAPAYQNHTMLARQTIIAPSTQNMQNSSPIIKIKPPLNILPKPPSSGGVPPGASKQSGARATPQAGQQLHPNATSPATQIVLPNQTILPTAQPGTLLLNQMPLIVQQNTAQGVQLILRPGTPNSGPHLAAAAAAGKLGTPQNLILQQSPGPGSAGPQVLIQHTGAQRQTTLQQPQQLVRVLTANGMIQQIAAPTYIAMNNQQLSMQQLSQQQQQAPQKTQIVTGTHMSSPLSIQHNHLISAITQQQAAPVTSMAPNTVEQLPPPKKKPKKKKKNKETKLDLANLMKLSGIGDDDVESDTSESAGLSEPNHGVQKIMKSEPQVVTAPSDANELSFPKRIGNIHISAISQDTGPKLSQTITTPATQNNTVLTNKNFNQSQISVQQSLSDINAINQNLAHIGLINQNAQNFISTSNQILSQINTSAQNVAVGQNNPMNTSDNQNLASFLQALNSSQTFPLINGQGIQNISVSQPGIPVSSVQGLPTFSSSNPSSLPTSTYPKFSANILPTGQSTNTTFASNIMSNIVTASSMNQNLTNAADSSLNSLPKSQATPIFTPQKPQTNQTIQNLNQTHFNLPNAIPNIQVQNFCGSNQNLILNQGANTIITPNIPNFSGNITINNSLIPNTNLTLPNNIMPNFLSTNLVQPTADVNGGFGSGNIQRTGGFKLALSEDGRLILQHDPNLNQDIQSQLLLQSIFGINLQGGNLVLTSVNNTTMPQPPKPITELPKPKPEVTNTKTTSIIQNVIPSIKTEAQPMVQHQPQAVQPIQHALPLPAQPTLNHQQPEPVNTTGTNPQQPNNFSYIVNLTPDQLETLKRNGQLTVNGQTIFMHRPGVKEAEKALNQTVKSSPKSKNSNKKKQQFDNKTAKTALQEHLHIKNQHNELASSTGGTLIGQPRFTNQNIQTTPTASPQPIVTSQSQTLISALQSPSKNLVLNRPTVTPQVPPAVSEAKLLAPPQIAPPPAESPVQPFNATQNMICTQPNVSKPMPPVKMNEPTMAQHLLNHKTNAMKPNSSNEQLIIFQPHTVDSKANMSALAHPHDKKLLHQELPKCEAELSNTAARHCADKPPDNAPLNVEQFLTNLNINPANLGQLISQKLSQELPGSVDHKIVNIAPGSTAGHIVAKIDIRAENMQQILAGNAEPTAPNINNDGVSSLAVPPLVSMNMKADNDVFSGHEPVQNQQLPALIIGGVSASEPQGSAAPPAEAAPSRQSTANTVYQRIQTIQLTPQKQQLLKSVQLQIQALTARLQQKPAELTAKNSASDGKSITDTDIHSALRHLFMEQQKILATGKVIPTINPPISSLNCSMETGSTQSVPVTTASKNNNTFLTSLLQQPVVSHHQNNKVYYHHANQIIAISPTQWQQNQNILPSPVVTPAITAPGSGAPIALKIKKMSPIQPTTTFLSPTKLAPALQSVERGLQVSPLPADTKILPCASPAAASVVPPPKRILKPTYSKAQLIEQQLTTDQNGAMNPDITRPFASKEDACKRLVRYHCYNQPVLSQKDLNKADEIFELTARHFIEKFKMMVNKYKYLLFKESMREVQTSELMMIDRMFLAEEQQSFLKLQSDVKLQNELELQENTVETAMQEMYKKETDSSVPTTFDDDVKPNTRDFIGAGDDEFIKGTESFTVKTEQCGDKSERYDDETNTDFNIKCGVNYFSDASCESSGNYRVYEQSPKEFDEFIGTGECFTTGTEKLRSDKDQKKANMESYNTTKIIGNFEIEINNKGCNAQESYTKNFRQKIIENKVENHGRKDETFMQKTHGDNEDYDEWLCIQRELGYFPPDGKPDGDQKSTDQTTDHVGLVQNSAEVKANKIEAEIYKKTSSHKRSSSDSSRLETLKKFRVEKHNAKVKKTGSIIGEVKFEVRIEHKKVFAEQSKKTTTDAQAEYPKQSTLKRGQCFDYPSNANKMDPSDLYSSKRACISQNFRTTSAEAPPSCVSCHPATIKQEEPSLDDAGGELNESGEIFDRSIDEQVQSAIDSILNLQQISSTMTGGTSAAAVVAAAAASSGAEKPDTPTMKLTGRPTDNGNSELMHYSSKTDEFCDAADTLDEAVKSILS
ncbi:BRD4 interacting chromatin remodeling complex associated protein [Carabus blaptoides fortunei]